MPRSSFKILGNQFIVPFGRFRLKRARPRDDSPVFIGRESQRAYFVDALTGIGERGAFLVTGRRGVGKSTFVENCLEDYRENAFRRFLGSGVGRSLLDMFFLVIFVLALLGILLAAGELLALLVPVVGRSWLLLFPLVICLVLSGLPFLMGIRAIRTALAVYMNRWGGFFTALLVLASLVVVLGFAPFGIPGEALATVIAGLGFLFFSSSLLYFFQAPIALGPLKISNGGWEFDIRQKYMRHITLLNVVGPMLLCVLGMVLAHLCSRMLLDDPDPNGVRHNFLIGGMGISLLLGTILGGAGAVWSITARKANQLDGDKQLGERVFKKTTSIVVLVFGGFLFLSLAAPVLNGRSAVVFVSLFLVSSGLVCLRRSLAYLTWAELFGGLLERIGRPIATTKKKQRPKFFAPPVEAVLFVKGFAYILVSVQLLFPILPFVMGSGTLGDTVAVHQTLANEPTNRMLCVDGRWLDTCGVFVDGEDIPISMFQNGDMATGWFVAAFLLLICLFLVEYEWISRPFVNQRQPRALDRAPRRPHQIHHQLDPIWTEVSAYRQWQNADTSKARRKPFAEYYRQDDEGGSEYPDHEPDLFSRRNSLQRRALRRFRMMNQQTFSYSITQLWLPVIEVNVNLGFDSLDHRGVTHAMLDGLRRAYRRKFVSLFSSPYAILRALALTFVIMIGVVQLGEVWFDMPDREANKDIWLNANGMVSRGADVFQETRGEASQNEGAGEAEAAQPASRHTHICNYLDAVREHHFDQLQDELLPVFGPFLPDTSAEGTVQHDSDARLPLFADLLCQAPTLIAGPSLELLYAEVVQFPVPQTHRGEDMGTGDRELAMFFTHLNQAPPFIGEEWGQSLSVRGYHLLLGILLFALLERIGRRFPILPYRKNLNRIEALIDDLTLRRADSQNARAGVGVGNLFELSRAVETSRDALDPRSVELKLLSLLTDLRGRTADYDGRLRLNTTMPRPDVHFIFDELDKLSGIVTPDLGASEFVEQDHEALDSERRRAYRLRALLSDMKRVISSAPARFIFVGGRTLHDEWVRDQNRMGTTQPLLTSIFDHEIYLPSLLVDFPRSRFANALVDAETQPDRALDLRIREYLINAYHSAKVFQETLKESRHVPFVGLPPMNTSAQKFSESSARRSENFGEISLIDARRRQQLTSVEEDPAYQELMQFWRQEFFHTFIGFLGYRSAGSPKKLNELLGELIRPSGSWLHPEMEGDVQVPQSQDALVIDETDLYRMQFINSLFRHIETSFGNDLLRRDDKITINTIFMFDFLMKMHNRAFSWSSIERLDELAHIHRAPDLRRLFDSVVSYSAERYFHRVLNGLFAFRFRSELAIEIRYLSRVSQTEMAALNFTLDESQELKATFTRMLENSGNANPDLMTALGELYEFDQAYDVARQHYDHAIQTIDAEFVRLNGDQLGPDNKLQEAVNDALTGRFSLQPYHHLEPRDVLASERGGPPDDPFLHAMLAQSGSAQDSIRLSLPWGIRRLRLMLQIGLTYEQQADEERAQSQYQSAQLFASQLLETALAVKDNEPAPLSLVLKHLPLIFQPVFASAWVAEKLENGVDTSLSIVENEIRRLRVKLPFVRKPDATEDVAKVLANEWPRDGRSNHLLVMAELHNKAGDLHFFKGRAAYNVKDEDFPVLGEEKERDGSGTEGYLFRAHFHYAMALHEIRRFVFHRRHAAKSRLLLKFEGNEGAVSDPWPTLDKKNLPTFVYQAIGSSMVDLAEVTLARSSVLEAWRELEEAGPGQHVGKVLGNVFDISKRLVEIGDAKREVEAANGTSTERERKIAAAAQSFGMNLFKSVREVLDEWFNQSDGDTRAHQDDHTVAHAIQDYIGEWTSAGPGAANEIKRLKFGTKKNNHERLLISLMLSLYSGRAVNRANYPDAASFENQITAEHVVRLLRSFRGVLAVARKDARDAEFAKKANRKNFAEHFRIHDNHLDLISVLIEIGLYALSRLTELKHLAYPEGKKPPVEGDRYSTTDTSEIVAAALATAMRNVISNLCALVQGDERQHLYVGIRRNFESALAQLEQDKQDAKSKLNAVRLEQKALIRKDIERIDEEIKRIELKINAHLRRVYRFRHPTQAKHLAHWQYAMSALERRTKDLLSPGLINAVGAYDRHFEGHDQKSADAVDFDWQYHRRQSRSLMIYLVTHHRYPALTNLTVLKALIDDISVIDGLALSQEDPFREDRMREAKTWFMELLDAEKLLDAPMHYPPCHIAETASLLALTDEDDFIEGVSRRFRWRAEQSFTMGRQYYQNISRLVYLFDDFNDRRRHSIHAGQMGTADMLALYRKLFDKRDQG